MDFLRKYRFKNYRWNLVLLVLGISIIGILAVGSAQPSLQGKQIAGVVLGVVVMLFLSVIDYNFLLRFYWGMYGLNLVLLLAVHFFGKESHNAKRWLDLGFVTFQPSDLTKILMILFFAQFLSIRHEEFKQCKGLINRTLWQAILLILPSLILIYKQPNLSNTVCISLLFCILLYLGGLHRKFIASVLLVVVPLAIIFLSIVVRPNQKLIKPYQQTRILAWLDPGKYQDNAGYQQKNSIMAIGSGQLTGKGLNNNTTTSVKNGNFISEPQTDFIFAIIGEELGFLGCCLVIILLLLIVVECIVVGMRAPNLKGQILCGGVASLIGIQSFINISVATGVFPNTGLSLPFVSYGLTSVVCMYMGIGMVLNVGIQPGKKSKE